MREEARRLDLDKIYDGFKTDVESIRGVSVLSFNNFKASLETMLKE